MLELIKKFDRLDRDTQLHSFRVEKLSVEIGEKMKLDSNRIRNLSISARYHDVGKIFVPYHILNSSKALREEERRIVMQHSQYSAGILKQCKQNIRIVDYALKHHENYDGTGYPFGLKESEIPLEAAIIRAADVFDALNSNRSYKAAFPKEQCRQILLKEQTRFHPDVLEILLHQMDTN